MAKIKIRTLIGNTPCAVCDALQRQGEQVLCIGATLICMPCGEAIVSVYEERERLSRETGRRDAGNSVSEA